MMLICAIGFWLMEKAKPFAIIALVALLCFFTIKTVDAFHTNKQHKLIVYNVPQHQAIDIISGRSVTFVGDSILLANDFLQNFHLKPARILQGVAVDTYAVHQTNCLVQIDRGVLLVDGVAVIPDSIKNIEVLILSHLPKKKLATNMLNHAAPKMIIADGTISGYSLKQLQTYCTNRNIRLHVVQQQGAFIINMDDIGFVN
jgi:competence protein ComEC